MITFIEISSPGEILLEEFIKPSGLMQKQVAASLGIPASRLNELIKGKRSITAEYAYRLSLFWNTSLNRTENRIISGSKGHSPLVGVWGQSSPLAS